jgi:threonine efflux protein
MTGSRIILTLALTQLVLAMTPGPNAVLVLQSALQDRKTGLAAAAGIWPVGVLWAAIGLTGLGALMRKAPGSGAVLSLFCAGYLLWLGIRMIAGSFAGRRDAAPLARQAPSSFAAFKAGALSNLTNPKTIAYFTSIFTATGAAILSRTEQLIVMLMMPTISFCWYGALVMLASHAVVRETLARAKSWLDRVAGVVMVGFSAALCSALWRRWARGM